MTERILALCRAMGASQDQEELLLPLVQTVQERLAGRLKENVKPEDCGPAFPLAAAMMVMDQLSGMTGEDALASFTAGDLTIRRENGGRRGGLVRRAEELLAPWTGGVGFAFREVPG